ncbi:MAG: hypothetical protein V4508_13435 [Pseudomonadota bacterium]
MNLNWRHALGVGGALLTMHGCLACSWTDVQNRWPGLVAKCAGSACGRDGLELAPSARAHALAFSTSGLWPIDRSNPGIWLSRVARGRADPAPPNSLAVLLNASSAGDGLRSAYLDCDTLEVYLSDRPKMGDAANWFGPLPLKTVFAPKRDAEEEAPGFLNL